MIRLLETTPGWLRLAVTLALMAALLALSIIPGRAQEGDSVFVWAVAMTPTALQKTMHVLLYALLAFLWAWTLSAVQSVSARIALALLLTAGFGASMEWAQTHIPGRFGTLQDALLNAGGAVLGLIAAGLLL